MDNQDQRWSTIKSQVTPEEAKLMHWFASIPWHKTEHHGAPPKNALVRFYQHETGVNCESMLDKLIKEGRFGLVNGDRVFLNAILDA